MTIKGQVGNWVRGQVGNRVVAGESGEEGWGQGGSFWALRLIVPTVFISLSCDLMCQTRVLA